MRLLTYHQDSFLRIGAAFNKEDTSFIVDLNRADPSLPEEMIAFLELGEIGLKLAQQVLIHPNPQAVMRLKDVHLGPPVPNPTKIICLGLNYQDHAPKGDQSAQNYPTFFAKYRNSIIGPEDSILIPVVTDQVDYEAELAVVIGKRGKDISIQHAVDYIAGYTAFNDISARDYQTRTSQWLQGKTFDTFGPMGPNLVTPDEIPDPGKLEITLVLNGITMQHSNTRHLIFSIPQIIAYLSQIMTLEAGDVISTGTPAGVGVLRKPPVFLKAGDRVEVHIEHVGVLVNSVSAGL
jgi:2-keto-4-pentenoate hydratase/2-oxohepta-3-ene-1,7-dioic acid hydratase in catechol pathway